MVNFLAWPKLRPQVEIAENTRIITLFGREVGLTYSTDTRRISVQLGHPMAQYWLSILEPIWKKQNEGKCPTCHGSGWDGIGPRKLGILASGSSPSWKPVRVRVHLLAVLRRLFGGCWLFWV